MAPEARRDAARGIADRLLADATLASAEVVAAYVSVGTEPGTRSLLEDLAVRGQRVLVPVVQPDNDLDWSEFKGLDDLRPGRLGVPIPSGPVLGLEAVRSAEVVLVPGLAVDDRGFRLGRGGGSYDRALGRIKPGAWVGVLLYDDEVGLDVPVEGHDRPVDAAITPSRTRTF